MSPELISAGLLALSLVAYALFAGADFGAGIWELHTALDPEPRQRKLLRGAIGPVWEANHVWLIFAFVLHWTAFPQAFAELCRFLYVPLMLALIGIVFRGAAYALRPHSSPSQSAVPWAGLFALASTMAPFFLGACIGALSGPPREGAGALGWLTPLSLFSGFFAVAACSFLSAVYLSRETALGLEPDLHDAWRRRALASGLWTGALACTGLVLLAIEAPDMWAAFRGGARIAVFGSLAAGLGSVVLLARERPQLATLAAVLAVGGVLGAWVMAHAPHLPPSGLSLIQAAAPVETLRAMLWVCAIGMALIVPALGFLFHLFKTSAQPSTQHDHDPSH